MIFKAFTVDGLLIEMGFFRDGLVFEMGLFSKWACFRDGLVFEMGFFSKILLHSILRLLPVLLKTLSMLNSL